jgi:hypothetical protein
MTVFLHSLLYARREIKKVAFILSGSFVLNLSCIIWLSGMTVPGKRLAGRLEIREILDRLGAFLIDIERYIAPKWLLGVFLAIFVYYMVRKKADIFRAAAQAGQTALLALFIAVNITVLTLAVPASFFRYLAPVIPVLYLLVARTLMGFSAIQNAIGGVIIAILIFSNHLPEYLYELTHNYKGPVKGIVSYLLKYGNSGDTVAITYEDLPLKFYTKMRVVGGLTGEDLSEAANARWMILRKYVICARDNAVREYLVEHVPWDKYEKIVIDYPDTPFENREELSWHFFKTAQDEDRVALYRRIDRP